jgi:hypothetical protein
LVSRSDADAALETAFPNATKINWFHKGAITALGATGPSEALKAGFPKNQALDVAWNSAFLGSVAGPPAGPVLVTADLTAFHTSPNNPYKADSWGGHHSDIYEPQIYDLMGWFLFA